MFFTLGVISGFCGHFNEALFYYSHCNVVTLILVICLFLFFKVGLLFNSSGNSIKQFSDFILLCYNFGCFPASVVFMAYPRIYDTVIRSVWINQTYSKNFLPFTSSMNDIFSPNKVTGFTCKAALNWLNYCNCNFTTTWRECICDFLYLFSANKESRVWDCRLPCQCND